MDAVKENIKITEAKLNEDGRVNSKAHVKRNTDAFEFMKDFIKEPLIDVGCRNGMLLGMIKDNEFLNLTGMDIVENSLEDKTIKYIKCDAHSMDMIGDGSYNTVTMSHMLEHTSDPEKVIGEIYRILSRKGIVYIEIPIEKKDRPEVGHFSHFSNKEELYKLFKGKFVILREFLDIKEKVNKKRVWLRVLLKKV